jgi:hypothetical protein
VVKSDRLVPADLGAKLKAAFQKLQSEQASSPDWHPGTNGMVQDLVHPSMYPLVFGETRVIREEVVAVTDAIPKWAGKGDVIEKPKPAPENYQDYNSAHGHSIPAGYWSDTYQWLPANVAFQSDGSVKLTSYINNLHPEKHPEIYAAVEQLIETALPAWDQCLGTFSDRKKHGAGRTEPRFGVIGNPEYVKPRWPFTQTFLLARVPLYNILVSCC